MHWNLSALPTVIFGVTVALLAWFAWDMRSMLKAAQRKNQLSIDGRWMDLENHFKRAAGTRRPFARLHRKYLMPGNLETQYALFLYKRGRFDEALAIVDQAIRQVKNKPWIFQSIHSSGTFKTLCGAFRTRTLILTGLGRYDEARGAAAEVQKLIGPQPKPNAALALLEYYCGHLDEALAAALATPPADHQFDSMRGIAALCQSMKGDFKQALQALSYDPADASKFYSDSGLKTMSEDPEGAKVIALQRKKLAGIFPPAQLILLAQVYISLEDFENADRALDQAEKSLGPEPGLQMSYCRHRACSLARQGKSKEAEDYIGRMRAIVKELPKRSLLWETHFTAGQSYFHLRRFNEALAELIEAQRSILHPIERHATAYWIARAQEAAGNQREADAYYRIVAADPIPSWMREKAAAALTRPSA
jgi:tetratricopeptide (TPR) repeat protein